MDLEPLIKATQAGRALTLAFRLTILAVVVVGALVASAAMDQQILQQPQVSGVMAGLGSHLPLMEPQRPERAAVVDAEKVLRAQEQQRRAAGLVATSVTPLAYLGQRTPVEGVVGVLTMFLAVSAALVALASSFSGFPTPTPHHFRAA